MRTRTRGCTRMHSALHLHWAMSWALHWENSHPPLATDSDELGKLLLESRWASLTEHHWVNRSVSSWAHTGRPAGQHWRPRSSGRSAGAGLGGGTKELGPALGRHGISAGDELETGGFNTGAARSDAGTLGPALGPGWDQPCLGPVLGETLGPALGG
jgi:hypothetical protein